LRTRPCRRCRCATRRVSVMHLCMRPFHHCCHATQHVNALLFPGKLQLPKPSSYGIAATASTSGSPARLCGNSNARPLLHVCNTSRTAACTWRSWRSSVDRQLQRKQRLWLTRLRSGAGRMRWQQSNITKSWPNMLQHQQSQRQPQSIVAESWPNVLRHWWSWCWLRNNVAKSRRIVLQCWQR
jgi:hypothetical protein